MMLGSAPGPLRLYFTIQGDDALVLSIAFKQLGGGRSEIRRSQNEQIARAIQIFEFSKQRNFENCLEESW